MKHGVRHSTRDGGGVGGIGGGGVHSAESPANRRLLPPQADLTADPAEQRNIVAKPEHAERVGTMRKLILDHVASIEGAASNGKHIGTVATAAAAEDADAAEEAPKAAGVGRRPPAFFLRLSSTSAAATAPSTGRTAQAS